MTLTVVCLAFLFNLVNGYLLGRGLFLFDPPLPNDWYQSPRWAVGIAVFAIGMATNMASDYTLLALRRKSSRPDTTLYRVPYGGAFYVFTSPNYIGEIVEWIGWSICARGSPASLIFAFWTAANLLPRAVTTHAWYLKTFPEYAKLRRAILIPGVY